MKKICFIIIAMLFLSSCSILSLTGNNHPEPPLQIDFRGGYELIEEFILMLEKDDTEIEKYLIKHNYHANRINTKKDMEEFLTMISETYFPLMEKAKVTYINVYTEWNDIAISCESIDGIIYNYRISTILNTAEEEFQSARPQIKRKYSENLNKKADDIKIYAYEKSRSEKDPKSKDYDPVSQSFFMDVRGASVGVRVWEDGEPDFSAAVDALQNTKFLKLDEILQNLPELKDDSSVDAESQSLPAD